MLETCGDAENQLALELSQHEVFVEKEIVDPLCGIAEVGVSVQAGQQVVLLSEPLTVVSAFDVHFFLEVQGVN